MDKETFDLYIKPERFIGDNTDFINTYAAKGPIILTQDQSPIAVWTDLKTLGYPNKGFVGKAVFRGGNWKYKNEKTPLDVYRTLLKEETKALNTELSPDTDSNLRNLIITNAWPIGDYFTAIPEQVIQNPNLQGWYCDLTSIFASEIDIGILQNILGLNTAAGFEEITATLELLSPEAGQVILTLDQLKDTYFGFGDGYKLEDVLNEKYGIKIEIPKLSGVEVLRLPTGPQLPFSKRTEILNAYLRKDNYPLKKGDVESGHVFEERS